MGEGDAGVPMFVVVPGDEADAEVVGVVVAGEAVWVAGRVFEGLEQETRTRSPGSAVTALWAKGGRSR